MFAAPLQWLRDTVPVIDSAYITAKDKDYYAAVPCRRILTRRPAEKKRHPRKRPRSRITSLTVIPSEVLFFQVPAAIC